MVELFGAIASIVLVDLALSGDNALVIGVAAAGLPRRQRRAAILCGGIGAIVLRVGFAFLASFLLLLPWLQAAGGVILLVIALRLLAGRDRPQKISPAAEEHGRSSRSGTSKATQHASQRFLSALLTILVADLTMSLDNVLAVGALAHGNLFVLSSGLVLSIAILLVGSALVARLMNRLPWLLDGAALVLAWTGAHMFLHDARLETLLNEYPWTTTAIPAVSLGLVLGADILLRLHDRKLRRRS